MAVNYVWPPGLPQTVQQGYTESVGMNILRSPMDAGPAKMRKRSNKPSILSVSFILTTSQVETLETFVKDTTKGIYRFGFPHPRTLSQVEVRIIPGQDGVYYTLNYLAPDFYSVSLQLEILP